MIQVTISPSSLLDEGVCVEEIDGLNPRQEDWAEHFICLLMGQRSVIQLKQGGQLAIA